MTNKTSLFLCLLAAYAFSPLTAGGQESLLQKTIHANSGIVYSVSLSPDGTHIVSGGVNKALQIWNAGDGALVRTLKGHSNFVNSVVFSPDGKKLASAGDDGTVRLWDSGSGASLSVFRGRDPVMSVAFFPDGARLASAGTDGRIRLWDTATGKIYRTIRASSGYVNSVAVSPDGKTLASGSAGGSIKIWDAGTGKTLATLEGHSAGVNSLAFSPSGDRLASGSDDGSVKLWRLQDGLCLKTFHHSAPVSSVVFSPDGIHIFSGSRDKSVGLWTCDDSTPQGSFIGHSGAVKAVAVTPDGKYMVSGGFDKTIKLWLTPWEAERRINEIKAARERDENYELHYKAGLQLLYSPTIENLNLASAEFQQALLFRQEKECADKLKETADTLKSKEQDKQRLKLAVLKALLALGLLLIIWRLISRARGRTKARKTLPDAIKRETLLGNYEKALDHFKEYKSLRGDMLKLHRDELRELYQSQRIIEELPKEALPYHFFLAYASFYAEEGNYRLASAMLRSGRLADELKTPEEYDTFAGIYRKIKSPEALLSVKLGPAAYSGLAEAFFRAGDHPGCEKVCSLKKQFYPQGLSARDLELAELCRKNGDAPAAGPEGGEGPL
jgi:tricorn protease-like protein